MQFDEQLARTIVRGLLRDQAREFFDAFPDYSREDVESETLIALRREWPLFDPALSQPQTFLTLVAKRRVIDLHRKLERRRQRDHRAGEIAAAENNRAVHNPPGPSLRHEAEEGNLADWLGNVYRTARRNLIRTGLPLREPRANNRYPDRAQHAALLALKHKLKLTSRAMQFVLSNRPDLLSAVGMSLVPHHSSLRRLEKCGARIAAQFSAARCPRPQPAR